MDPVEPLDGDVEETGICNEPVIDTEPVNLWVSSNVSPKLVEPLENDSVKYVVDDDIINCCAVILPPTYKSSVKDNEPVIDAPPALTLRPFFTIN